MGVIQDLRFALRVLVRKPTFTAIVIFTLALGLGAGSAMFSVIHALLVRPLDFPDLDRLATVQVSENGDQFNNAVSPRTFLDYHADAQSFQHLAAVMTGSTQEDYQDMMLKGGRSVEGNRSKSGRKTASTLVGSAKESNKLKSKTSKKSRSKRG